jgi:hypothetical protein
MSRDVGAERLIKAPVFLSPRTPPKLLGLIRPPSIFVQRNAFSADLCEPLS